MIVASSTSELPFVSSAEGKEKKRLKATEIKNPYGRVKQVLGTATDITQLKQTEVVFEPLCHLKILDSV
jgi:hypothetical protein